MGAPEFQSRPRVSGVILAAGLSTRFVNDVPKQLYRVGGQTLVYRTARVLLASRLRQIVVVTGHRGPEVAAALAGLAVEVVENRDFRQGQGTSVKAGLARVEPQADAVLFVPCDLPALDTETIDRLVRAHAEANDAIVVPTVKGERRAPVLWPKRHFESLGLIRADQGARQLFADHEPEIVELAFDSPATFDDLDRSP